MKILSILIDMLRPNLMNIFNEKVKEFELDKELRKIGGTVFTNCFSPSPDTPRSFGALWSGLTPMHNGCDKRIKYPKHYLNSNNEHMLQVLKKDGYSFNFFIKETKRKCGLLPKGFEEIGNHNSSFNLKSYLDKIEICEKSFTHIDLSDFHYANDDYSHNYLATKVGYNKIASAFKIINQKLSISEFDIVIIFSDHGHKLDIERRKQPKYKLLDRDRSNIFMQIKRKDDNTFEKDHKLCAIYDVFPTIMELTQTNTKTRLDGISLLNKKEHDYILAEDHFTFSPKHNQEIDLWAVIKKDGFYFRTTDNYYFKNESAFTELPKELDRLLSNNASRFAESQKEREILIEYNTMNRDNKTHSDGTKRFDKLRIKYINIPYQLFNRVFLQNWKYFIFK